jgi:hypothetical protein
MKTNTELNATMVQMFWGLCNFCFAATVFYGGGDVTLTVLSTSATWPFSNIRRLKLTFAVRFVLVNGWLLVMTKLKVVFPFGSSAGRPFVPPITHLVDWPTILP